jgi:hypothetical protein
MNPWIRVGVDEPGSRVEGGEPVLCDYGSISVWIDLWVNFSYTLKGTTNLKHMSTTQTNMHVCFQKALIG